MHSDPDDEVDYAFIDRLEGVTARVGRSLLIGFPALFLVGLLLLPLGLPAAPALLIVVVGAIAVVWGYEVLRSGDRRERRSSGGLSTPARVAIIGTLLAVSLYAILLVFTLQSQTPP